MSGSTRREDADAGGGDARPQRPAASPVRTLTRVLVLAAAVGLLGAMLLFIGNSLRTMTGTAIRSVPLDWQGPVASYAQAAARGRRRRPAARE